MGGELGQLREWDHDTSIDWDLLEDPGHAGIATWFGALNRLYLSRPSLRDDPGSFRWISCDDVEQSVVAWERCAGDDSTAWIFNLTPVPRQGYRVGFPAAGSWALLLCSDAPDYGGSGYPVEATLEATAEPLHERPASAVVTLPPVSAVVYGRESK
jgi:1,4-alpha-glucan branching enzyme